MLCYNVFTITIDKFQFYIIFISKLIFSFILYIFEHNDFLKDENDFLKRYLWDFNSILYHNIK